MTESPPDTGFTPISPNPYIVGNPVRDRAMFFGREAEFELVRKRFQHSTRGGLLVFCGERRSGKTSILFQIMDQRLGTDFIPVLIDMQSMAVGSEVDFLQKLSDEVLEALEGDAAGIDPPRFTPGSNHSATLHRFIEQVLRAHPKKKLILLFDEYELFENKIDSGTLAEDALSVLSHLMENQSVFLVFTGSQHLEQRRRDYWKILGKSIYKQISYLERADALNLIRKPVEGRVHYDDDAVEAIYRFTAGQPFYTQAICQSLIDHLNELRTARATRETVTQVVDGIVDNPLPQMIFLWDGLERDEKLVLALLAESLTDDRAHTSDQDLGRLISRREYPLELDKARIATALEKLFKSELLLRSDVTAPPGYAFRMDLWRLWIRRMHSVWQVMREEGLEIRPGLVGRRKAVYRTAIAGGIVVVLLAGAVGVPALLKGRRSGSLPVPAGVLIGTVPDGPTARFGLETEPADALISMDGRRVGIGTYSDGISAGLEHRFRLTARGYADSEISVRLAPGDSAVRRIGLRALVGDLRIETRPPGAEINLDGQYRGRSPFVAKGLLVPKLHHVVASLKDVGSAESTLTVQPDVTTGISLAITAGKTDVVLTTDPAGADITLDGRPQGKSNLTLSALTQTRHTIGARRDGYVPLETTLAVTPVTRQVNLPLQREPPGVLIIQGDRLADIYLDEVFLVGGVQNSGAREAAVGPHQVRVVLTSGEQIDKTVVVKPRQSAIYDYSKDTVDYSKDTVARKPKGGSPP